MDKLTINRSLCLFLFWVLSLRNIRITTWWRSPFLIGIPPFLPCHSSFDFFSSLPFTRMISWVSNLISFNLAEIFSEFLQIEIAYILSAQDREELSFLDFEGISTLLIVDPGSTDYCLNHSLMLRCQGLHEFEKQSKEIGSIHQRVQNIDD